MKTNDEYLESIFAKRDALMRERKKKISVITSILCIALSFAAIFAFVPEYFKKESPVGESENNNYDKHAFADTNTSNNNPTSNDEAFTFGEEYQAYYNQNNELITDEAGNRNMNDSEIKTSMKNYASTSNNKFQTEIAAETPDEETTRRMNFGYIGEPFDPDLLPTIPSLEGEIAYAPAVPPEEYDTELSEPCLESPDSIYPEETKASTTAAKPKSAEEATAEAKNFLSTLSKEDSEKIIDEKTQVTVTRTANGKTTYKVYFYTNYKSFEIEVDAVTLRIIDCKQKNLVTGYETYISPAHFPETTAALPEYKPQ